MVKKKIEFYDSLIDVKVKDVLSKTDLSASFNKNRFFLQTNDREESCELEYHYEKGYDGNDPKEAIIDSLYVYSKTPVNLLKELESKLYLKFVEG